MAPVIGIPARVNAVPSWLWVDSLCHHSGFTSHGNTVNSRKEGFESVNGLENCSFNELHLLAREKGTDQAFRRWVSFQPSCISGQYSEWVDGFGRCEAAHVRRTWMGSGTGKKGDFCCVPLTRAEHNAQHQHGETHFAPKEWWENQALKYLKLWLVS